MMKLLPYMDDINAKRYDSRLTEMTLLHVAAFYGNAETAKVLLANGIDENAKAKAKAKASGGFERSAWNIASDRSMRDVVSAFRAFSPPYNDYAEYRIAE